MYLVSILKYDSWQKFIIRWKEGTEIISEKKHGDTGIQYTQRCAACAAAVERIEDPGETQTAEINVK